MKKYFFCVLLLAIPTWSLAVNKITLSPGGEISIEPGEATTVVCKGSSESSSVYGAQEPCWTKPALDSHYGGIEGYKIVQGDRRIWETSCNFYNKESLDHCLKRTMDKLQELVA